MKAPKFLLPLGLCAAPIFAQETVIARETTIYSNSPDTFTTVYSYDRDGFLVRKVTNDSLYSEWDEKGRYLGLRLRGDTDYIEKTQWFSDDSAQRRTPGFDQPLGERYFGRRKNTPYADSIYLYRDIHLLMAKRKYTFDSRGNPTLLETLWIFPDPDVFDTSAVFRHNYRQDGRLLGTYETNLETGPIPLERISTFQYADFGTVTVDRSPATGLPRSVRPPPPKRAFRYFDILGRARQPLDSH